jgi:uncharacterized membrane protein YcjF (UPF0283 family)
MKNNRHSASAFIRSVKGATVALFGAAIVACVAVAVVWPLWYLATSFTRIYTAIALVAIAAAIAALAIGRIRAKNAEREIVIARPMPEPSPAGDSSGPVPGAPEDAV